MEKNKIAQLMSELQDALNSNENDEQIQQLLDENKKLKARNAELENKLNSIKSILFEGGKTKDAPSVTTTTDESNKQTPDNGSAANTNNETGIDQSKNDEVSNGINENPFQQYFAKAFDKVDTNEKSETTDEKPTLNNSGNPLLDGTSDQDNPFANDGNNQQTNNDDKSNNETSDNANNPLLNNNGSENKEQKEPSDDNQKPLDPFEKPLDKDKIAITDDKLVDNVMKDILGD